MYLGIPRFDDKIAPEPNTGCWLWTGAVAGNGYPSFKVEGRAVGAHVFAWETFHGRKMRRHWKLMHRCDTPLCCNPHHLKPGHHKTNMRDMIRKGRGKGQWTAENRPEGCVPRGSSLATVGPQGDDSSPPVSRKQPCTPHARSAAEFMTATDAIAPTATPPTCAHGGRITR